ncbi:40S ribosomal S8 [Olea europaea subsp. europaea]|uniref:40S ribosomal S8 n=1 Tax=Olea europaea subsp. europaea TaxID=158383 RepID=A0A8S0TN68_OLEEU|nr:40S ribosomal S8 [Olea europaea subsp. europaea]
MGISRDSMHKRRATGAKKKALRNKRNTNSGEKRAAPFKQWCLQHYGVDIGRKKKATTVKKEATEEGSEGNAAPEETKKSNHVLRELEKRQQGRKLDSPVEEQFGSGRGLAFHLDQVNVAGLMGKSHMWWHYLC